jgi:hypothetical protein
VTKKVVVSFVRFSCATSITARVEAYKATTLAQELRLRRDKETRDRIRRSFSMLKARIITILL